MSPRAQTSQAPRRRLVYRRMILYKFMCKWPTQARCASLPLERPTSSVQRKLRPYLTVTDGALCEMLPRAILGEPPGTTMSLSPSSDPRPSSHLSSSTADTECFVDQMVLGEIQIPAATGQPDAPVFQCSGGWPRASVTWSISPHSTQ